MNPDSARPESESLPCESSPSSSSSGTVRNGVNESKYASQSPRDTSTEHSAEETGSPEASSSSCEICEPISLGSLAAAPVSEDQLRLTLAQAGKRCFSCRRLLPIEVFSRMTYRDKPGVEFRNPRCNECRNRFSLGTPLAKRNVELVRAAKARPCADCGQTFDPVVMDFDHVRGEKLFTMGAGVRCKSTEAVLAELAKCDVVCSNCHRLRTKERIVQGLVVHRKRGRKHKFLADGTSDLSETRFGVRSLWRKPPRRLT